MLSHSARVVVDTLLPAGAHDTLPMGAVEAGFAEFWLDFERTALPSFRWAVRAAIAMATWIAPVLIARLPPLSLHDRPTRERALAAMAHSRLYLLRQMADLLKTTVSFSYGADPRVRAALGYPQPPDDPRSTQHP